MNEVQLTSELVLLMLRGEILVRRKSLIEAAYKNYDEVYPQKLEVESRCRAVMDTIDDKLGIEMPTLILSRKTLIYALFACLYDVMYGFDSSCDQKVLPKSVSLEQIAWIKLACERIQNKSAPVAVLDATARRTTNVKERSVLFTYLRSRGKKIEV